MGITPELLAFLLIFVRSVSVIGTAPIFGGSQIPAVFKVGLSFFLALLVANTPQGAADLHALPTLSFGEFALDAVLQVVVGFAIGTMATTLFNIAQFAGELLDQQIGFSIATVLSPGIVGPVSLLGNFFYLLFALWFLSVNGHYAILLALLDSFRIVPLTGVHLGAPVAGLFLKAISTLIVVAVQLAAPILLALFLTNVSLAIASRAVPQMNVFVVGLPATLLVGLVLLVVLAPDIVAMFSNLLTTFEDGLASLLRALGGGAV
jgi:flagellar biosynthetic protein FliR